VIRAVTLGPRPLAGERLLAAWEDGARCHEVYRPLALLAAALRETGHGEEPAALAALPVAERDLLLVRLREATFGPDLEVFGRCTACGTPLEFTMRADEVAKGLEAAAAEACVEWTESGRRYRIRPATTDDLAATLTAPDAGAAETLLLARCLEAEDVAVTGAEGAVEGAVEADGTEDAATDDRDDGAVPGSASSFPASVVSRFAELHAAAEVGCAVDCPACATHQVLDLDIGRFLWREVTVAARRLLAEVHLLACAYGWAEQDILALSPARRAAYLELAGAS
jgi:hypothetical protein